MHFHNFLKKSFSKFSKSVPPRKNPGHANGQMVWKIHYRHGNLLMLLAKSAAKYRRCNFTITLGFVRYRPSEMIGEIGRTPFDKVAALLILIGSVTDAVENGCCTIFHQIQGSTLYYRSHSMLTRNALFDTFQESVAK